MSLKDLARKIFPPAKPLEEAEKTKTPRWKDHDASPFSGSDSFYPSKGGDGPRYPSKGM